MSAGCRVHVDGVVGRYGLRLGVGPVVARWQGPGLVWVTGPNGSGKSTLLRLVAGLKRPARGWVRWADDDGEWTRGDLRRHAALAGPEIRLWSELTLAESLGLIAELRGLDDPESTARAALAEAGLGERADERPEELSSGLRQRARLAAAWLGSPALVLLDEPSSNLDAAGREWLWQAVRARARTALCVVATNQLDEIGADEPRLELGRRAA